MTDKNVVDLGGRYYRLIGRDGERLLQIGRWGLSSVDLTLDEEHLPPLRDFLNEKIPVDRRDDPPAVPGGRIPELYWQEIIRKAAAWDRAVAEAKDVAFHRDIKDGCLSCRLVLRIAEGSL